MVCFFAALAWGLPTDRAYLGLGRVRELPLAGHSHSRARYSAFPLFPSRWPTEQACLHLSIRLVLIELLVSSALSLARAPTLKTYMYASLPKAFGSQDWPLALGISAAVSEGWGILRKQRGGGRESSGGREERGRKLSDYVQGAELGKEFENVS